MTFASVLAVGSTRDRLGQATHEPGEIAKPISQHLDSVLIAGQRFGALGSVLILARIQPEPAGSNLLGRPLFNSLRHDFHDDVEMIAHHGVAPDRHSEDVCQFADPVFDPLTPVLVRLP